MCIRDSNLIDLFNLALQEKNDEILEDCSKKIEEIHSDVKKNEINCFLSGENDDLNIFLENKVEKIVGTSNSLEITTSKQNLSTRKIINCAGLQSDLVAQLTGIKINYKIRYYIYMCWHSNKN